MAPPRVVDVRRRIVVVGEVRVAPGPQAILDRVACHDYPRFTRKAHDVNNNTNKRPCYFDVREDLEEAVADLTSGANVVDGDGGRWSRRSPSSGRVVRAGRCGRRLLHLIVQPAQRTQQADQDTGGHC